VAGTEAWAGGGAGPPVPGVARVGPPAAQVEPRVERGEPLVERRRLGRGRAGRGQFLDADVAEVALRALRLEADISLARDAPAGPRDLLAVDGELEHAVVARGAVVVPLGRRPGPLLDGQAAHPAGGMRPVRLHRRAPDAEDVAVAGVVGPVVAVEDLHLERARERHAD